MFDDELYGTGLFSKALFSGELFRLYQRLLDEISGAVFATAYTKLKTINIYHSQVRRFSDNVEYYVGFDSNNNMSNNSPCYAVSDDSYAGIVSSVFSGVDGLTSKAFDLSGNTDATQSSASNQPELITSGSSLGYHAFDGIDDVIRLPTSLDFNGNSFSIVLKAKLREKVGTYFGYLSSRLTRAQERAGYSFRHEGSNLIISVCDGVTNFDITETGAADGVERTYILTVDRTGKLMKLYVNGSQSGLSLDITACGDISNSSVPVIGAINPANFYSDMDLSACLFFNKALSESEITTINEVL
jgi:hypothetical protein